MHQLDYYNNKEVFMIDLPISAYVKRAFIHASVYMQYGASWLLGKVKTQTRVLVTIGFFISCVKISSILFIITLLIIPIILISAIGMIGISSNLMGCTITSTLIAFITVAPSQDYGQQGEPNTCGYLRLGTLLHSVSHTRRHTHPDKHGHAVKAHK
ncbi:unnamed protein product [Protopolystoma xenopodis]|uniref:Uncharacterized protein n=1 Tax=Protopolystoma xenopodis TaxID=117903 RepID=A0A3S5C1E9_9PLAT|nr:unnamed protein product [Protopolystoma xenopodis]